MKKDWVDRMIVYGEDCIDRMIVSEEILGRLHKRRVYGEDWVDRLIVSEERMGLGRSHDRI